MLTPGTQENLEKKFTLSRNNLLAVIAFTCVNIVLALTNADFYFLYSASIPLYFLFLDSVFYTLTDTFSFSSLGIIAAFASVSLYGIFWVLSKNYKGFIIAALAYFSIDVFVTLLLLASMAGDLEVFSIIELLFMGWIMFHLINGTIAWAKMRKLPPLDETMQYGQNNTGTEAGNMGAEQRTIPVAQIPPSAAIRQAAKRGRVLAEYNYNNVDIALKRTTKTTELIVNDMVYAERTGINERKSYTLEANVYNIIITATIEVPPLTTQMISGALPTIYLYVNGALVDTKTRYY